MHLCQLGFSVTHDLPDVLSVGGYTGDCCVRAYEIIRPYIQIIAWGNDKNRNICSDFLSFSGLNDYKQNLRLYETTNHCRKLEDV